MGICNLSQSLSSYVYSTGYSILQYSSTNDLLFHSCIIIITGVVLLTMHQYSQPIGECIADLKSVQPEIQVAPLTAIKVLFSDGLVELCNVIIAFLLFRFTGRKQPGNFSTPAFVTAAAMIPFVLGLYFNSERVGCIVDADGGIVVDADGHGHAHGHGHAQSGKTERQFPVAVLYHLIVTGCVWFMNYFMDQTDKNLASVTKLHKELSSKNSRKNK